MSRRQHPQTRGMKKRKKNRIRAAKKVKVRVMSVTPNPEGAEMSLGNVNVAVDTSASNLKWTNKKKKTSGTFVALYKEMLNDVPENLKATPEARIAMYRQIQATIEADAVRRQEENTADTGKLEVAIPWTMLDFPKNGAGRSIPLNVGHVGHMVQNYDAGSYQTPVVVMRPVFNDDGELITVHFEITDGMHRSRVTLERAYASRPQDLRTGINPVKIRVSVSEVATTQETAKSFTNNNVGGLPVPRADNWRNMYLAGVSSVVSTVEIAAEYGIDASAPPNLRGWPRVKGKIIQTMRNLTDDNTPNVFPWINETDCRNALRFITDPACKSVYKNQDAINTGMFFGGLCHFIAFYVRPGYVHDVGMRRLLSMPDLIDDVCKIANKMHVPNIKLEMPFVTDHMIGGNPDKPRNENLRYFGVAAALRQLYVSQVPPPKSRSSSDGWFDCPPELRQLFHNAPKIVDETERRHYIEELRAKITAKEARKQARERSLVR